MKHQYQLSLYILLISAVFSPLSAQNFQGMICGNPDTLFYTGPEGIFYPDFPYPNPLGFGLINIASHPVGIDRVTHGDEGMDSLYFFRREGEFSYVFEVNPGYYAVNLYTEEKTFHGIDFRSFSVNIEGTPVIQEFDIFEFVGKGYCVPLRYLTECNDNLINVDFVPDSSDATLSAISVCRIYEDTIPPVEITGLTAIAGYDMNILYWDYVVANDLAGYRVYRREGGGAWEIQTTDIHPLYRYIDYEVITGTTYDYTVSSEDLWGNESELSSPVSSAALPPSSSNLIRHEMEITDENLYQMNLDVAAKIWVDADITLEGVYYPDSTEVRYRGGSSVWRAKKNYKASLGPGVVHDNRDDFNLNGEGTDASIIINRLGYGTFDLLGIANPVTQPAYLDLNGKYIGVYLEMEQVDNHFLERIGWSKSGNLYKCQEDLKPLPSYSEYEAYYLNQNHEGVSVYDVIEFIEWMDAADSLEFRNEISNRVDVDGYTNFLVGLIAHSDDDFGYNNYFMYNNPTDNRWYFVGWDHNLTFSKANRGIDYGTRENPLLFMQTYFNRLHDKLLHDDFYNYVFCKKLQRFLLGDFSAASNMARIDSFYMAIYDDAMRDLYKKGRERPDDFLTARDTLYWFANARVDYLLPEIDNYITDPDRAPYFRINEIQSRNRTTILDEAGDYDPWIEIVNLSSVELDLSGFTLHFGPESWSLPDEAVLDERGFLIVWLDGEPGEGPFHASFTLPPSQGTLWLEGNHSITADSVDFPLLELDQVWAREVDGVGNWVDNMPATPGTANSPEDPSVLVINEFMADNETIIADSAGEYEDWIEIFNTSPTETISLGGLFLTDELSNPHRWVLPDTTILPQGFLLVWCDNDLEQGLMHAAFQLGRGGEEVGLYDRDGVTPIDTLTYLEQPEDLSWGRYPDGADDWGVREPTPGDVNVGIHDDPEMEAIPTSFSLSQNFPNPFNPSTTIEFGLPHRARVQLAVYNIMGREVGSLIDHQLLPGYHRAIFNAVDLSSGIYFVRIEADEFIAVRKMLLLK